ncbi:YciI family protein [Rhodopirellula sp. JC740]|uniref:YciI family protein n=1 Tax=Rhodopirellula halodulae TaxID=2894198 RepID=A0ABS8NI61_9BACT|nr:YciI family protein [Rhodopirellula sp. JC740]MCC9643249.1 YciI family protein [Rhodopirellula sp. JC740]
MRVMVMVKASPSSEAGKMPDEALLTAMGKFNQELVDAGIMQAGEGLKPSSEGVRVHFHGNERLVTDGPFAETKELIAGYWIWEVDSMDEAVRWVRRCPNPMMEDSDIDIRPIFGMEDFGETMTEELRQQEAELVKKIQSPEEAELRRAVKRWSDALEAKDCDGLVRDYAPEVVLYGAIPPYKFEGPEKIRELWQNCLPNFPAFESVFHNMKFHVAGEVAFAYGLHSFRTEDPDHPAGKSWMRVTIGYERQNGEWKVVHEHVSLPFNPMTNQTWLIEDPEVLSVPDYDPDACAS